MAQDSEIVRWSSGFLTCAYVENLDKDVLVSCGRVYHVDTNMLVSEHFSLLATDYRPIYSAVDV